MAFWDELSKITGSRWRCLSLTIGGFAFASFVDNSPSDALIARTESANFYQLPDGSKSAAFFPEPVNYRNSVGVWRPIESHLEVDEAGWHNAAWAPTARPITHPTITEASSGIR